MNLKEERKRLKKIDDDLTRIRSELKNIDGTLKKLKKIEKSIPGARAKRKAKARPKKPPRVTCTRNVMASSRGASRRKNPPANVPTRLSSIHDTGTAVSSVAAARRVVSVGD